MGDVLKGWRRKAWCVMVVMACTLVMAYAVAIVLQSPSTITRESEDAFFRLDENTDITKSDRRRIQPVLIDVVARWEKQESLSEQLPAILAIIEFADANLSTADRVRYRFVNLKEGLCIVCIDLSLDKTKVIAVKAVNCER